MKKRWLLALCLPGLAFGQTQIEYFDTDTGAVIGVVALAREGIIVTVYDLSAPEKLEATLSEGLSSDPQVAAREAAARIAAWQPERIEAQVQQAYQGRLRAAELGIDRVPAVVIDGAVIVYGLRDLHQALAHYRRARALDDTQALPGADR